MSYDRSASISAVPFTPTPQLFDVATALAETLPTEDLLRVQSLSQIIVNHICTHLGVRTIRVQVQGVRPSNQRGELHGLYTQYAGGSSSDSIQVWMRTAKRGHVVAFRTFLRTLLHEVCHHLDYTYFQLRESYHTEGFFQRESSLFRVIVEQPAEPVRRPGMSLTEMAEEILAKRRAEMP